jgi:hypothetical protein
VDVIDVIDAIDAIDGFMFSFFYDDISTTMGEV